MIKQDLHTHTTFCDGSSTAEEMVISAIEKGLDCIGFSGHSLSPGNDDDTGYGMDEETAAEYRAEIGRLKEKYKDQIKILCGMEMDYYSENDLSPYEYIIGSVHEVRKNGGRVCVDYCLEHTKAGTEKFFGGDYLALAEEYFETVGNIVEKTHCDIIGHFDLLTKFNEQEYLFDTNSRRYKDAWKKAADKLLKYHIPFEINTGAISRGYRTSPYPSDEIIDYLRSHGAKLILSSDSHDAKSIAFMFNKYEALL